MTTDYHSHILPNIDDGSDSIKTSLKMIKMMKQQGGPGTATMTLVYYIYNVAFVNTPKYGYASAISMVLFVLVLIVTIIQFRGSKGEN